MFVEAFYAFTVLSSHCHRYGTVVQSAETMRGLSTRETVPLPLPWSIRMAVLFPNLQSRFFPLSTGRLRNLAKCSPLQVFNEVKLEIKKSLKLSILSRW